MFELKAINVCELDSESGRGLKDCIRRPSGVHDGQSGDGDRGSARKKKEIVSVPWGCGPDETFWVSPGTV